MFYDEYIKSVTKNDERTRQSVDATIGRIDKLLSARGATEKRVSGLVVGRVQSGKTRNYIGLMLKGLSQQPADMRWNVIIILTSNIVALAEQTQSRIVEDIKRAGVRGCHCSPLDFLSATAKNGEPDMLGDSTMPYFYWGVAMKERNSLSRVKAWFDENICYAGKMRVLIVDDEADYATPDSNTNRQLPMDEDQIDEAIEDIRDCTEDDFSPLADWLKELKDLDMPDPAANTTEAKAFNDLTGHLKSGGDSTVLMTTIFGDPNFRNILGINATASTVGWVRDLQDLAEGYFCSRGERSPSRFIEILRSILEIALGRSAINNAIVSIVDRVEGATDYTYPFQQCAYIAYTATPYACILNERPDQTPLYADFIASIDKSPQYFGLDEIYGSNVGSAVCNMDIVRSITPDELQHVLHPIEGVKEKLKGSPRAVLHHVTVNHDLSYVFDGKTKGVWQSLKTAVTWAFCTAAARRWYRINIGDPEIKAKNYVPAEELKKLNAIELRWTTMLFNISQKKNVHKQTRQILDDYIKSRLSTPAEVKKFIGECQKLWETETKCFGKNVFDGLFNSQSKNATERYGDIREACTWQQIEPHLQHFFKPHNCHVIIINCTSRNDQEFYNQTSPSKLTEDHLWFICGGNTIARGLTLTGLTTSYFDRIRKTVAVDTTLQMARWFGYRINYELYPRIWMTPESVTEMKKNTIVEDRMHQSIRENFIAGFDPGDESHYQPIYSYGRKLSGRVRAQCNESVGVGTYGSTDDISVASKNVKAVVDRTKTFLKDLSPYAPSAADEAKRAKECTYGAIPLWRQVPKQLIVDYLRDVRVASPRRSRCMLEGLLQEIDRAAITDWDVVIGEPENSKVEYDIGGPRKYRAGSQQTAIVVDDVAHFTAARLHIPYYAAIPATVINEIDFEVFRKEYVAKIIPALNMEMLRNGGRLPPNLERDLMPYQGNDLTARFRALLADLDRAPYDSPLPSSIHSRFHGSLEGYRNRSSSVYMEKVHDKAGHTRPTLQIYLLNPPNGIATNGLPLVSLAFYWPKHEPGIFHAVCVGLQPRIPTVSRRRFFETVVEVLENYDFPMSTTLLKMAVIGKLKESCPEAFFNKNIAKPPLGYDYEPVKNRHAYVLKNWAQDVENRLDNELLQAAVKILQDDGHPHTSNDLYGEVLRKNPKLNEFFACNNAKDKSRFNALFTNVALTQNKLVKVTSRPITFQYQAF